MGLLLCLETCNEKPNITKHGFTWVYNGFCFKSIHNDRAITFIFVPLSITVIQNNQQYIFKLTINPNLVVFDFISSLYL